MSISANVVASPMELKPVVTERRRDARHRAIYRPCCVLKSGKAFIGIVRNFSEGGAKIEIDAEFEAGEKIVYFWEQGNCIEANVVWAEGREYGLEHLGKVPNNTDTFPVRSVRVPCEAEAVCWIGGEIHSCLVQNISIGGMLTRGLPPLPTGTMMTVNFCGLELASTTVRWSINGQTGLSFAERLSRDTLAKLLLDERFGMSCIEFDAD